jgi:hypothetical protein
MDTNPQYRPKTDPRVDPDIQYNTDVRSGMNSTGWIIGGLIALALIAAFFMWGGTGTPPQPTTGTTTTEPATPPAPEPPAPEQTAPQQPAPQGGTTGQGTTNP